MDSITQPPPHARQAAYIAIALSEAGDTEEEIRAALQQLYGDELSEEFTQRLLSNYAAMAELPERPLQQHIPTGDWNGEEEEWHLENAEDRRNMPDPEWLVEDCIQAQGLGMLYGESQAGKSFVAIDLSLRLANDNKMWHGHDIKCHGNVVYIALEGGFDFRDRIEAWLKAHPGRNEDRLYTLTEKPFLIDEAHFDKVITAINEAFDEPPVLVVIDTFGQAIGPYNENANTDMSQMTRLLKQLYRRLGCAILVVHHVGKDASKEARGASSLKADMDFSYAVTLDPLTNYGEAGPSEDDRNRATTLIKQRAAQTGSRFAFKLVPSGNSVWAAPNGAGRAKKALETLIEDARAIARVLSEAGIPLSPSQLAEEVFGVNSKATRTRVIRAVQGAPNRLRAVGDTRSKKVVLLEAEEP